MRRDGQFSMRKTRTDPPLSNFRGPIKPPLDGVMRNRPSGLKATDPQPNIETFVWASGPTSTCNRQCTRNWGTSRSARGSPKARNLILTARAAEMLKSRKAAVKSPWVFPGNSSDAPVLGTSLDHQHYDVRDNLKLSKDFVVHSLRHTMLTRLGESGAGAFDIMRIAGHSSVTVSQRYVHPTPEGMERAFERMQKLNAVKFEQAEAAAANGAQRVVKEVVKVENGRPRESAQVFEFKRTGP